MIKLTDEERRLGADTQRLKARLIELAEERAADAAAHGDNYLHGVYLREVKSRRRDLSIHQECFGVLT